MGQVILTEIVAIIVLSASVMAILYGLRELSKLREKNDKVYIQEFLEKIRRGEEQIKEGLEFQNRYKTWVNVSDELPPPSHDEYGFGDIRSKDVIIKDENDNYDIQKYDHLAKTWTGSRNVIAKFWKYIE